MRAGQRGRRIPSTGVEKLAKPAPAGYLIMRGDFPRPARACNGGVMTPAAAGVGPTRCRIGFVQACRTEYASRPRHERELTFPSAWRKSPIMFRLRLATLEDRPRIEQL